MQIRRLFYIGVILSFIKSTLAFSNTSCEQIISYVVPQCLEIGVSGNPTLHFSVPNAGENFSPVSTTAHYSLSCNQTNYTLCCKINHSLSDLVLYAELAAPQGAVSSGQVALSEVNQPVISSISKTMIDQGMITYILSPKDPKVLPSEVRGGLVTVIFTLSP